MLSSSEIDHFDFRGKKDETVAETAERFDRRTEKMLEWKETREGEEDVDPENIFVCAHGRMQCFGICQVEQK